MSRCALCMLVCENWHWQRDVCFACGSVKLSMGGSGVGWNISYLAGLN